MTPASLAANSKIPESRNAILPLPLGGWILLTSPFIYGLTLTVAQCTGSFLPSATAETATLLAVVVGSLLGIRSFTIPQSTVWYGTVQAALIGWLAIAGIFTGSLNSLGSAIIQKELLWLGVSLSVAMFVAGQSGLAQSAIRITGLANAGVLLPVVIGTLVLNGLHIWRSTHVWSGLNVAIIVNTVVPILTAAVLLKGDWPRRLLYLLLFVIGIIFALVSGRRLIFISLTFGILGWWILRQRPSMRVYLGLLLAAGFSVVAVMVFNPSLHQHADDVFRPLLYSAAWQAGWSSPCYGIGLLPGLALQDFPAEAARWFSASGEWVEHVHSTALQIFLMGGVPAFLLWAAGMFHVVKALWVKGNNAQPEIACAFLAFLTVSFFDPSMDRFLGRLNLSITIGIILGGCQTELRPAKYEKILQLATPVIASCIFALSLPVAVLRQNGDIFSFRQSIRRAQDMETLMNSFNRIVELAPSLGQDWVLTEAIAVSRKRVGWFGAQVTVAANRSDLLPADDRASALITLLMRMPFQDRRYYQLGALLPEITASDVTPRVLRRTFVMMGTMPPDQLRSESNDTEFDLLADTFCRLVVHDRHKKLTESELAEFRHLVRAGGHCKSVALLGLSLFARDQGVSLAEFHAWNPAVTWALSDGQAIDVLRRAMTSDEERSRLDQAQVFLRQVR